MPKCKLGKRYARRWSMVPQCPPPKPPVKKDKESNRAE